MPLCVAAGMRVPVMGSGRVDAVVGCVACELSPGEAGCGVGGLLRLLNGACDLRSCALGPVLWSIGATIGLAVEGDVAIVPPKWPPPIPPPPPPAAIAFGVKAKLSAQAPARSVSFPGIVRGMFDFSCYGSFVFAPLLRY
jgi:hypothetical protein